MKLIVDSQSVNQSNILNKTNPFCADLTFKISTTFFKGG